MDIKLKKIIARELLILIIPIIPFVVIGILVVLYLNTSNDRTYEKYETVMEKVKFEKRRVIDSLKTADSLESIRLIKKMKEGNEPSDNVELVKRHSKNKTYNINDELTNIYGDTVTIDPSLLNEKLELQIKWEEQNSTLNNFKGGNLYDGLFGLLYCIFLIIAYPIRLLFYSIIWAIKTLRTS